MHRILSAGQCAAMACLLEVSVPKPGNVHRGADFHDMTFLDLAASAVAIAPAMDRAESQPLGKTVLQAVTATRQMVTANTNLGIVLLLAPLAKVPWNQALAAGIGHVLCSLDAHDSRQVYQAIRLARPGGLGTSAAMDVQDAAPSNLLAAMGLAADRDAVAAQYVTNFDQVLNSVSPRLIEACGRWGINGGVIHVHVQLLAEQGDSLIARKCGARVAAEAAARAQRVLDTGEPGDGGYLEGLRDLDFWLRSDANRRNPGTTADLITAGLFCALRDGGLALPL